MRFMGIGMQELLIIFLICLLVFGASRLPEIGRALGKTINEFKKSMKEDSSGLSGGGSDETNPDRDNKKS
jgi:twin arginine-targeting protein translocase, TatA/E family